MKRWAKRVFLSLLAVFLGIQLVPVNRANPAVNPANTLQSPPEVEALLRASCYDCHSDETRWRWYGQVAPVSWLLARDVNAGRKALNFSHWGELAPDEQAKLLGAITGQITTGDMPPPNYLAMHGDARLSPVQIKALSDWTDTAMKKIYQKAATKSSAAKP